jgi:hypothetical protein
MAALLCIQVASVGAHHYFSSAYDAAAVVRVSGRVARIEWSNPHTHFYLDAKDAQGSTIQWMCEAGSPGTLQKRGLQRGDVKAGDALTVEGYKSAGQLNALLVTSLTLASGRVLRVH